MKMLAAAASIVSPNEPVAAKSGLDSRLQDREVQKCDDHHMR